MVWLVGCGWNGGKDDVVFRCRKGASRPMLTMYHYGAKGSAECCTGDALMGEDV